MPEPLTGRSVSELATKLTLMESSLNTGEKAKLELATYDLPTQDELDSMWLDMLASGFHVTRPTARVIDGIPVTELVLTKGSPTWAALIPLIPTALIVGLIVFGITQIGDISKALVPLLLTGGGIVIILAAILTRKPVVEAAERYAGRR